MSDSLPSDHPAVDSYRVHLSAVGRTGRLQIPLPDECSPTADDIVSLSFGGRTHYGQVETTLDGQRVLRGAYRNRRQARERDGENTLRDWLRELGLGAGDPLLLDVLTSGYAYGVREPGQRVVYHPPDQPDTSLTDIARSLDGDG